MTEPQGVVRIHVSAGHVTNDEQALAALRDVPFLLYAARQGAKLFWALACKRWPELRGMR